MNKVVPQTDIYALGVVFYESVTGRKPYTADTPAAVLVKQTTDPLPRPKQFVPNLPDKIEQVIFKALAKNYIERYANMDEFSVVLENLVTQTNTLQVPASVSIASSTIYEPVRNNPTNETLQQKQDVTYDSGQSAQPLANLKRAGIPAWVYLSGGVLVLGMMVVLLGVGGWLAMGMGKKTPTQMAQIVNVAATSTEMHLIATVTLPDPTQTMQVVKEVQIIPTEKFTSMSLSTPTIFDPQPTLVNNQKPVDFLKSYYDMVSKHECQTTWTLMSEKLKSYLSGYAEYDTWCNTINKVEFICVNTLKDKPDSASVVIKIRYYKADNIITNADPLRIDLTRNATGDNWLIDNTYYVSSCN
jgi:serine/threonine protein kinase